MFRLNSSTDGRPSRTGSKTGLRAIASKLRPDLRLAVDTDVSRHHGSVPPEQVFPCEGKRKANHSISSLPQKKAPRPTGLRRVLDSKNGASLVRNQSVKTQAPGLPSRPDIHRVHANRDGVQASNALAAPVLHNRVRGLRPAPLDLDISPSDRAIPIGITIPSAAISNHTSSPLTATQWSYSPPQYGFEATTPTIVITPAKEEFDLAPPSYPSQRGQRPVSSVYSRYTNCAPRTAEFAATPPVPPLPLFAQQPRQQTVPESKVSFEQCRSAKSHKATLSVCTVFEEDQQLQTPMSAREPSPAHGMRPIKRQSTLPTPRRSRGWWNLITSPFSARSNTLFWRSPTDENSDRTAILSDASAMGAAEATRDFVPQDRMAGDESPRSAPATGCSILPVPKQKSLPKRSITAPGALDANADVLNIYRVPSQGAAAAYYDQSRNYPSLIISPDAVPKSMFEDDSPLTDVCACEHHRHGSSHNDKATPGERTDDKRMSTCSKRSSVAKVGVVAIPGDLKSPFDDSHAVDGPAAPSPPKQETSMFTSPTAEELASPSPIQPTKDHGQSTTAAEPRLSDVTATPIVEHAHVGTMVGPRSSNGEQRAVIIPPSRAPSPPNGDAGLQAATREPEQVQPTETPPQAPRSMGAARPPMHSRESSRGLGISNTEQDLFPPPRLISEKPRLGTDVFGQLVILKEKDDRPRLPWYRRFLWLIITGCVSLLLLLIVLLIVLVPQLHSDNAVQAQWLNLTGFPPMPTGISTVIQPKKSYDESTCTTPANLWSCAVPLAQKPDISPILTEKLPNFRLEIRFRNNILDNSTALLPSNHSSSPSGPASAQVQLHRRSNAWTRTLNSASPPPPSESDQLALGEQDKNSQPYNGEETPFYLTLLNPRPLPSLSKRSESSTNPYPYPNSSPTSNATTTNTPSPPKMPKPLLRPNGEPAMNHLYPYASAQPLRLYNRGQDSEHYGFYTYFDKSVLISNSSLVASNSTTNKTNTNNSTTPTALCTFTQTRFKVQIWTRRLAGGASEGNELSKAVLDGSGDEKRLMRPAWETSANEMGAPGSFPYGVSFTLDREVGTEDAGGVFCWALDRDGVVAGDGIRFEERGEEEEGECGCGWEN